MKTHGNNLTYDIIMSTVRLEAVDAQLGMWHSTESELL